MAAPASLAVVDLLFIAPQCLRAETARSPEDGGEKPDLKDRHLLQCAML